MKPIVLHVAAEVSPFHKSGGLGDVMSGLPPALSRAGVDARIVTPHYGPSTNLQSIGGDSALRAWPVPIDVSLGGVSLQARVLEARTHGGEATTYFVDAPHLSRGGLYGHGDDPFRFAILGKAAVAIAKVLGRASRIGPLAAIHAHDWHAALAVYHARGIPTVITIHNLSFQGQADAATTPYVGITWDDFHALFEHHGTLNLLKGAILAADRVTTVSPTYANEIQTPQYGHSLDGLLRHVAYKLRGLVNGIDARSWDPAADKALPANYSATAWEAKEACREALRFELGLAARPGSEAPLVGAVSRLTHQKGIDQLCDAAAAYVQGGGQIAVLGEGEPELEHRLHWLSLANPGAIAYRRAFDDGLARRIYAGSDLFAMPSRFEPCGLAQMYAMRYGAIPIARATGGLVDTITPLLNRHEVGDATGILYSQDSADALLSALSWGREVVRDEWAIGRMRWNAMTTDDSWDHAARAYLALYRELGVEI
jgi:starch synthase